MHRIFPELSSLFLQLLLSLVPTISNIENNLPSLRYAEVAIPAWLSHLTPYPLLLVNFRCPFRDLSSGMTVTRKPSLSSQTVDSLPYQCLLSTGFLTCLSHCTVYMIETLYLCETPAPSKALVT